MCERDGMETCNDIDIHGEKKYPCMGIFSVSESVCDVCEDPAPRVMDNP